MKISAKTEYACIAVMELAARYECGEPVRIRDIAQQHGIPSRFLVQILLQLKGAGLVASTRGAAGGYRLQRPPGEITLGAVMGVVDGLADKPASNAARRSSIVEVLAAAWQEVADVEREMLESTTFVDLIQRTATAGDNMYYI